MLMVIFGAGASYDSVSSLKDVDRYAEPSRPPLAKELFLSHPFFREAATAWPPCLALFPYLEPRADGEVSVEEILDDLQARADAEGMRQLAALKYYIRDVIRKCQSQWAKRALGVSNYVTLFDQVRRLDSVVFVSFNYDTLLEAGLEQFGLKFQAIVDYINDARFSVIKPHGSVDWEVLIQGVRSQSDEMSEAEIIRSAPTITATEIRTERERRRGNGLWPWWMPSIAIPVTAKASFACPQSHIDEFKRHLSNVTHVVTIGWRASEEHFLKELQHIREGVKFLAVSGSEEWAMDTIARLRASGVHGNFEADRGGFTDFVRNRRIEGFLNSGPTVGT